MNCIQWICHDVIGEQLGHWSLSLSFTRLPLHIESSPSIFRLSPGQSEVFSQMLISSCSRSTHRWVRVAWAKVKNVLVRAVWMWWASRVGSSLILMIGIKIRIKHILRAIRIRYFCSLIATHPTELKWKLFDWLPFLFIDWIFRTRRTPTTIQQTSIIG